MKHLFAPMFWFKWSLKFSRYFEKRLHKPQYQSPSEPVLCCLCFHFSQVRWLECFGKNLLPVRWVFLLSNLCPVSITSIAKRRLSSTGLDVFEENITVPSPFEFSFDYCWLLSTPCSLQIILMKPPVCQGEILVKTYHLFIYIYLRHIPHYFRFFALFLVPNFVFC